MYLFDLRVPLGLHAPFYSELGNFVTSNVIVECIVCEGFAFLLNLEIYVTLKLSNTIQNGSTYIRNILLFRPKCWHGSKRKCPCRKVSSWFSVRSKIHECKIEQSKFTETVKRTDLINISQLVNVALIFIKLF